MTDAQRMAFYLPAWQRAFAIHWQRAGKLGCVPRDGRPANPHVAVIEEAALALAQAAGRRLPTEEMLRHAATAVATTHYAAHDPRAKITTSSKALTTAQTNHLVALLDLLTDPDNLAASVRWDHPERAEAEAVDQAIRQFPAAYVAALARSARFRTDCWQGMELGERKQLLMTLRNRARSSQRSREGAKAETNLEGTKA